MLDKDSLAFKPFPGQIDAVHRVFSTLIRLTFVARMRPIAIQSLFIVGENEICEMDFRLDQISVVI